MGIFGWLFGGKQLAEYQTAGVSRQKIGAKSEVTSGLNAAVLIELTKGDPPEAVVEEVVDRAAAGETFTAKRLFRARSEHEKAVLVRSISLARCLCRSKPCGPSAGDIARRLRTPAAAAKRAGLPPAGPFCRDGSWTMSA